MMSDARQNLERALETALAQYAETMGEAFPIVPILEVVDDPDFWAMAEMYRDKFRIRASVGTADCTANLWALAFSDEKFSKSFGISTGADAATMAHISLVWLMLHEMHHFQMGHFDNPIARQSSQAGILKERGLVTRVKKSTPTHSSNTTKTRPIIEMQADHDATEMLLDAYSPDEWISLRARVAAISAMMMLIERVDDSYLKPPKSHPKAATRIFQLLGHIIDMPILLTYLKIDPINTPAQKIAKIEEQKHFASQVVVPAIYDAVALAEIIGADSISTDLGNPVHFFKDVQLAKSRYDAHPLEYETAGAQQWANLKKYESSANYTGL